MTTPEAGRIVSERPTGVRDIDVSVLRETIARLLVESNSQIPADVLAAPREAAACEESPLGRRTLEQLIHLDLIPGDQVRVTWRQKASARRT